MNWQILLLYVNIFFVLILAGFVFSIFRFFRLLSKNIDEKNLKKLLERLIKQEKENQNNIKKLFKEIKRLENNNEFSLQKFSVVRFNPFNELGGDHSFCFTLLNGKDDGFIVTALHARERTRIYTKKIKKGKSEVVLSKEEKKALVSALKKN